MAHMDDTWSLRGLVFSMYLMQGLVQGLLIATIPTLLRQRTTMSDAATFSFVMVPFQLKVFMAPLADAVYSSRLGRRESWLYPTNLLVAVVCWVFSDTTEQALSMIPIPVASLALELFFAALAVAMKDVVVDAWSAEALPGGVGATLQSVGLQGGFLLTATVYFVAHLNLATTFRAIAGLAVLNVVLLKCLSKGGKKDGGKPSALRAFRDVLSTAWSVLQSKNGRLFVAFLLLKPLGSAHVGTYSQRFLDAGFTPELTARYDILILPVALTASAYAGKMMQCAHPMEPVHKVEMAYYASGALIALLYHFLIDRYDNTPPAVFVAYIVLTQLFGVLGMCIVSMVISFVSSLAGGHPASAATIIALLLSITNFAEFLHSYWTPWAVDLLSGESTCDATGLACNSPVARQNCVAGGGTCHQLGFDGTKVVSAVSVVVAVVAMEILPLHHLTPHGPGWGKSKSE